LPARAERLGQRCRNERSLRIHIARDIVVECRGQISLQFRVDASHLGMVAQIVTKQKAAGFLACRGRFVASRCWFVQARASGEALDQATRSDLVVLGARERRQHEELEHVQWQIPA